MKMNKRWKAYKDNIVGILLTDEVHDNNKAVIKDLGNDFSKEEKDQLIGKEVIISHYTTAETVQNGDDIDEVVIFKKEAILLIKE